MTALYALLLCPVALLVGTLLIRSVPKLSRFGALLMWVQMAVVLVAVAPYLGSSGSLDLVAHGFRLDGMAALFVVLTTLVFAAALTHGIGFFERETGSNHPPSPRNVREFYFFASLFLLSMYVVVTADNLGFLWIAVEATTLLSAPLVYYHRSNTSLEATWKYLIICSVGIAFAFFGTAILYTASQRVPVLGDGTLSISLMTEQAQRLPHGLLRLGFVFALLGYGTKAGLFPLHTWLPDAHSEAPAPASAMLSGSLLNCALVAIWRISRLMVAAGDGGFVQVTLMPMAVATVLAASLLMLRQRDLKRLLAYSSMENIGVMAVAIALSAGTGFALQAVNHSLVKVALFLLAGNLLQSYGTKNIRELRGVLSAQPAQGVLLLFAAIAVAGTPPFGSFLAEWQILTVAADGRHIATVVVLCIALAVAFIGLAVQIGGIVFNGDGSEAATDVTETPVPKASYSLGVVPAILLLTSLVLGVMLPLAAYSLMGGSAR